MLLQKVLEGLSGIFFQKAADIVGRQFDLGADVGQSAAFIMRLNIFQDAEDQILFVIAALIPGHRIGENGKIHEDQSHGDLIDGVGAGLFVDQVPEHVFDQILDRQDLFGLKVQVSDLRVMTRQGGDKKTAQHIFPLHHGERTVEELRQNDKVDCDIVPAGGQDLMGSSLVEKKQVSLLQDNPVAVVYDVCGRAAAHMDQLGVIVAVPGKMREAGVRTDLNQVAAFQKLCVVHHKFPAGGVDFFLNVGMSLQKGLFFGSDLPQVV